MIMQRLGKAYEEAEKMTADRLTRKAFFEMKERAVRFNIMKSSLKILMGKRNIRDIRKGFKKWKAYKVLLKRREIAMKGLAKICLKQKALTGFEKLKEFNEKKSI